jgi:CO dehydrogenase nickel-insertion accessory protein CooC1
MEIDVGESLFILNRATDESAAALQPEIERLALPLAATVPEDAGLFQAEVAGLSLLTMPDSSPAVSVLTPLFDKIFASG